MTSDGIRKIDGLNIEDHHFIVGKMRVFVIGRIEGMTKDEVRKTVESMGHEYCGWPKSADIIVFGSRTDLPNLDSARDWRGIKVMAWEDFVAGKEGDTKSAKDLDTIEFDVETRRGPSTFSVLKISEMLWLQEKGFTKIDLSAIREIPKVSRLHLDGNDLAEIDLKPVQDLSWLILSDNALQSIDLSPVSDWEKLNVLELANNSLETIDLSPLSNCERLQTLVLSGNRLTEIDLSPLRKCRIENLHLSENALKSIDLSPIEKKRLQNLFLDGNQLESIDLTPLTNVRNLNLSENALSEIDLLPLKSCDQLGTINLASNLLKSIDFASFSHLQWLFHVSLVENRITEIDLTPVYHSWTGRWGGEVLFYDEEYDRSNILLEVDSYVRLILDSLYKEKVMSGEKGGFSKLRDRISWMTGREIAERFHEKIGWNGLKERLILIPREAALSGLSMLEFAGLERPIEDLVRGARDDESFEEGAAKIYDFAIKCLKKQLDNGGPIKNLDIESMQKTSAVILIPKILDLRKKEIESVVLQPNKEGEYDLREIRGTYYGSMLVNRLDIGWQEKREALEPLLSALDDLGLEVKILSKPKKK